MGEIVDLIYGKPAADICKHCGERRDEHKAKDFTGNLVFGPDFACPGAKYPDESVAEMAEFKAFWAERGTTFEEN